MCTAEAQRGAAGMRNEKKGDMYDTDSSDHYLMNNKKKKGPTGGKFDMIHDTNRIYMIR